jgi:hypothetical protein
MKKIKIFLVLLCGTIIVSCESNTIQDVSGIVVSNPTYVTNIKPVIDANCIVCHYANGQYPNLGIYNNVKDAAQNGDLLCRIDQSQACGSVMPPTGALPQATINMFKLWASQGYAQ